MKLLIFLYKLVSASLFILAFSMLLWIIVSMFSSGLIMQYAEGTAADFDDQLHNDLIGHAHVMMWLIMLMWCVLTPLFVGVERIKVRFVYIKLGLIGCILSIIYILSDPFGLLRYYND